MVMFYSSGNLNDLFSIHLLYRRLGGYITYWKTLEGAGRETLPWKSLSFFYRVGGGWNLGTEDKFQVIFDI